MDNNAFSNQNSSITKEASESNPSNINLFSNNPQKIDKNIEETEENDNLAYNTGNNYTNFNNLNLQKRLDSTDSPMKAKFSIDLPNVSKQRLHEYLNDDLLNAIECSPQISNLNSDLNNTVKKETTNNDNNPNNLIGFSLYPQNSSNIGNNNGNKNFSNIPEYHPSQQNAWNQNNNHSNVINNSYPNIINNNFKVNNYNYNINYSGIPNISNQINLFANFNGLPMYIPKLMRNNEYKKKNATLIIDNNSKINASDKINSKNKFDNNKKIGQNSKKEGKFKKPFEVRAGDWTCSKCSNLNFSFRNKCNRCGLPKEMSIKYANELINQNVNINFTNDAQYE